MKCDLCDRRAVIYRPSSGHRLCLQCLDKVLERGIRRSLSKLGALAPGKKVLVPVTCYNTLASLGLAHIVRRMKKGYGTKVTIAIPSSVRARGMEGEDVIKVMVSRQEKMSMCQAFLYDRTWSLRVAKVLSYDAVLFPLTATDGLLLTLHSIFEGEESLITFLKEVEEEGGIPIINALLGVEASTMAAYAALHGLEGRCLEVERGGSKHLMEVLKGLGPEAEFSYLRVIEFLSRRARKYENVFQDMEVEVLI
ncbi:MAG: hypothetical protein NZ902_02435 [Acidilobaceae archaeon]|nr:hypothetical protein [Acidilobaceae archaeon]MCX8165677.1 hypothetical protein [Acidilobaceae archaeon]MDW7974102.1 hypothetical protein [Sulfolobales archaeon]